MSKKIKIFGSNIQYRNNPQLSNILDIGDDTQTRRANARQALKNLSGRKVIHNNITGDFEELKLSDKPLLIRQFTGIKRITKGVKDAILTGSNKLDINVNNNDITIKDNNMSFTNDDILSVNYSCSIRLVISDMRGTLQEGSERTVSGTYRGVISDRDYKNFKHIIISIYKKTVKYSYNPKMTEAGIRGGAFYNNAVPIDINDQSEFIQTVINDILTNYKHIAERVYIDDITCMNVTNRSTLNLQKMKLKSVMSVSNIVNLYNEIIPIKNNKINCVISYLTQKYKKIAVQKYFNKHVPTYEADGIDTEEIKKFCERYDIKLLVFDIAGNVIQRYKPEKKGGDHASLIYIAYNSHIYPVLNKVLNKVMYKKNEMKEERLTAQKLQLHFKSLISNDIIPANITISDKAKTNKDKSGDTTEHIYISSFVHDNTLYFSNDDYDICLKILKLFNIDDEMTPYTNRFNIISIIEKLYNIKNTSSFFPQLSQNSGLRFDYVTNDKELLKRQSEYKSIDKNKAYAYALYMLDFIQMIDIRKTEPLSDIDINKIDKLCLYIATPHVSSILMPDSGYYDGAYLIYCQNEGLKFDIVTGWECDTQSNPFKNMIKDYYEKTAILCNDDDDDDDDDNDNDDDNETKATINHKTSNKTIIKLIINIWLGQFDNGCDQIKISKKVEKIADIAEALHSNGAIIDYNDKYKIIYNDKQTFNIYTRKPIKYQLLNMARKVIYEKFKELKLTDKDIICIKTDSITFLADKIKTPIENIGDDFTKWKIDKYDDQYDKDMTYDGERIDINEYTQKYNTTLIEGYAGCGKTHGIINKVITQLKRPYIILSPSHSSIEEYRQNKINCDVIQKYIYNNEIPSEDIIIIDEVGLCDTKAHNVIYKMMLANKTVLCCGDFKQLDPVADRACNTDIYLNYAFTQRHYNYNNYRNNFSIQYYDNLINGSIDLKAEIIKYNSKRSESEYIICVTNSQCEKYNSIKMKQLKITKYDKGCLMMCKKNKLRKLDIYNNFIFEVVECDDIYIYLKDKTKTYKVTRKQYEAYFIPAYARTLYNIQGKSIKSYHVPPECVGYFAEEGRRAYTLISRLKQKKDIENNDIQQPKITNIKSKTKRRGVHMLTI